MTMFLFHYFVSKILWNGPYNTKHTHIKLLLYISTVYYFTVPLVDLRD